MMRCDGRLVCQCAVNYSDLQYISVGSVQRSMLSQADL